MVRQLASLRHGRFVDVARRHGMPGVGVRLDLSRGFDSTAEQTLTLLASSGCAVDVMVPLARTLDLGYAREGRLILDPTSVALLDEVRRGFAVEFGFLADPCAIIGRVLNTPVVTWRETARALASAGIPIRALGAPLGTSLPDVLDLLWVYRAAGLLFNTNYLRDFAAFGYESREFLFERLDTADPVFSSPVDGIARAGFTLATSRPKYCRALQVTTAAVPRRHLELSIDWLIHTDHPGWRIVSRDGTTDEHVSTGRVIDLLEGASADSRIGLVVDPAHIRSDDSPVRPRHVEGTAVRLLPYPYDHFLSVSSDIDWATHDHLEETVAHVCDEMALPFANSAYLHSADVRWPSWSEVTAMENRGDGSVRRLAGAGALDTIHGLNYSFDTVYFLTSPPAHPVSDVAFDLPVAVDLRSHDGIMVTTGEDAADLQVTLRGGGTEWHLGTPRRMRDESCGLSYALFDFGTTRSSLSAVSGIALVSARLLALHDVHTFIDAPAIARRTADAMRAARITAPVFTAHGGAEGTRRFGSCVSSEWAGEYPDETRLAMDRRDGPFYALDAVRRGGVRFLNPAGPYFSISVVENIRTILRTECAQDGTTVYTFARFFSRRFDETGDSDLWTYGKHGATAQGLAATFEDVLQQLNRSASGSGTIIYTHLGHKAGNQLAGGLGWNAELRCAWDRIAEYHFGRDRDDPVPFRVWVAPPAAVLSFAALLRGISGHIDIRANRVDIRSWRDEVLACDIPAPSAFGGSWLHGLTIALPDPWAARAFVDGIEWTHYTANDGDGEDPSITLVDANQKLQLFHAADGGLSGDVVLEETGGFDPIRLAAGGGRPHSVAVRPVSLRNVTHWTFEVDTDASDDSWRVGFVTDRGDRYEAGGGPGLAWTVSPSAARHWRRITLALAACAGATRPAGRVTAVELYADSALRVRDVALIRPKPTAPRPVERVLSGIVRSRVDGRPRAGVRVVCCTPSGGFETETNRRGEYLFTNVPDGARCRVAVDGGDGAGRGGTAVHMTADYYDWDLVDG